MTADVCVTRYGKFIYKKSKITRRIEWSSLFFGYTTEKTEMSEKFLCFVFRGVLYKSTALEDNVAE